MILGMRIRELRKKCGYTQQQLGNLIKVTKVSVCCYENGTRTPNLETLLDLAEVLNTNVDYLVGRDMMAVSENTPFYISKEEIKILQELRKSPKLYEKFITEPKRAISMIEHTLK